MRQPYDTASFKGAVLLPTIGKSGGKRKEDRGGLCPAVGHTTGNKKKTSALVMHI